MSVTFVEILYSVSPVTPLIRIGVPTFSPCGSSVVTVILLVADEPSPA